ncbi:DEAD/DEAH box helicase [Mesobacillus zeae]|uniref:DEAD/DEAH box helicase n=1 Tax=Mesobacillus zeae TaxID=1917180 RepID=UPI00300982D9
MNIELRKEMIEEMCGAVSLKRGDSFYRSNKVIFEQYLPDLCEATVKGKENFHVTVKKSAQGDISAQCSCPKLASVKWECQHVAAVLLSIYERQRRNPSRNQALTKGLMGLFTDQPVRISKQKSHFEDREILDVTFTIKPVLAGKGTHLFGIEARVGSAVVPNIREFLNSVKEGRPSWISPSFEFDPGLHCFQKETDAVIQQLISVIQEEKVYIKPLSEASIDHINDCRIILSPSSWEKLLPLLVNSPLAELENGGNKYAGLDLSDGPLPLVFDFLEEEGCAQLEIKGLELMNVMDSYGIVLFRGKLHQLEHEDCQHLSDLEQMLDASGTQQISIPQEQLGFFLEKVVPGLRRLGKVNISHTISKRMAETPLIAKLYLDRVKNRLLAGLEFHYGNIVINPLESRQPQTKSLFIRDVESEEAILTLMDESSFAKTDGGYYLQNEELEYEFLYHTVPKLQKLVQIYATTAVRNRIFRRSAPPQVRVRVKKERTNWLEFKFELDGIPEKDIREVLQAIEEKRKYYRLRNGSLLSLEAREYEEIHRFLHALPVQKEDWESSMEMPFIRGLQALDSVEESVLKREDSFHRFMESLSNQDDSEFEVPKSLDHVLRDYQKRGFKWMKTLAKYGFGGILADDMGLGKTLQSITFILSELPEIRRRKHPILIVCPSSLMYNWLSEIKKFTPEVSVAVINGDREERMQGLKMLNGHDVLITSYPLLRKDIKEYEKQAFHTVFFDEAQAFKNPLTQTAKAVQKLRSDYRFALTGTPVENAQEELWSIYHVVFPGLFQGLKEYSNLSRKKIARRIRPFLLRRMKEDVLSELPEKIESMETVELFPEQKKLYAAYLAKLRHDTLKHLNKQTLKKNRIKILAGLTRLRQICCHPALFVDGYKGSSAKFEQLLQLIEESRLSNRRLLIFSQFTKMLELIGRELTLQGLVFFYLDGQTPSEERLEISNRFNEGERDLFLISLKAGGTGLNLTGADTVILYDSWWNPAVEEQAADRAHRMGQTHVVQVIKLITRGTIEEKINELQDRKRNLIEEIIDIDEKTSSALTEEDIREILRI